MSLPLDFRSALGQELSSGSTPDSQGLGTRPVYTNEVPTPPVPPRDELLPVPPALHYPAARIHPPFRRYLPSAMTDLKLGMDWYGMPITPFCYFVAPELISSPRLFPRFMDLPPEIHRIVFQFCDTPTLFHLMHVSSYTRQVCSDLFWKSREEDIWYRPWNSLDMFYEDHPMVYDCPEFASRVTQVEITLTFAFPRDNFAGFDKKREFWRRVQDIFPSAQKVVLCDPRFDEVMFPLSRVEYLGGEYQRERRNMAELVALAPPNITVMVATFNEIDSSSRSRCLRSRLWSVDASNWSLVKDLWTPMRVVLPPKKIRPGQLNYFLASERLGSVALRELYGANWLKWESYVRYADASGIECPHPDCDDRFPNTAEWEWHLHSEFHKGNIRNHINARMLTYHRNTPAEAKAVIDEKQRRFADGLLIKTMMVEELFQLCREHGKCQFQATLVHQLEEYGFLTYAKSLNLWEVWCGFVSEGDDEWDDDSGYPEDYEVDSDQEYPGDEELTYDYARKQYPDDSDLPDEKSLGQSRINAEDSCSSYAGEEYFDYSQCTDD